jgi:hypothetical protein
MDRVYGSHDHDWLSVHGGLAIKERCGCSGAHKVIMMARREREREREREEVVGFSPMVPLGGGAAEMVTRRRSAEAAGGAPMG